MGRDRNPTPVRPEGTKWGIVNAFRTENANITSAAPYMQQVHESALEIQALKNLQAWTQGNPSMEFMIVRARTEKDCFKKVNTPPPEHADLAIEHAS
jgi:hypothetical protein